jgi:inosose dehydratase
MATTADPVVRIKVGNAPCSFGVMAGFEPDPPLTYLDVLDQIGASGFAGTELGDWGFMPADAAVLTPQLDQRNLAMIGAFTPLELTDPADLDAATATALRSARLLAACATPQSAPGPYLILAADAALHPLRRRVAGRVKPAHSLSYAEARAVGRAVNQIATVVLAETGIATVFHPHCGTPVETVVETSQFAMMTDPDLVGLCFDTGHVAYAGDALDEWLTLFAARTRLVHFKDMNAVIANHARGSTWDYATAVRNGLFCPLGEGSIDFAACLQALSGSAYAGWIVVEDEIPPGRVPPLQAATSDRAFLRGLGL